MKAIQKILRTPSAFVLLLVAIISFIGVIIKGEFDKAVARIPIEATLTAEAMLTESALVPNSTIAKFSTETSMPISTPTLTPTLTPTTSIIVDEFSSFALQLSDSDTQSITLNITIRNDNSIPLDLMVYDKEGTRIITMTIPAGTMQTIKLPAGNYTYEYKHGCRNCYPNFEDGNISLTEPEAICIGYHLSGEYLLFC